MTEKQLLHQKLSTLWKMESSVIGNHNEKGLNHQGNEGVDSKP